MDRITPENITHLEPNQIFVFGSNKIGRHGKGAAKTAMKWGAKYGVGVGLQGQTYGIPTKGHSMSFSLPLETIEEHVQDFIGFAKAHPELTFLVTKIGCGLAGYDEKDIAPLFHGAVDVKNIWLPKSFWQKLICVKLERYG